MCYALSVCCCVNASRAYVCQWLRYAVYMHIMYVCGNVNGCALAVALQRACCDVARDCDNVLLCLCVVV